MEGSVKVAYLAHEIPGASSTFVYNEIFALEQCMQAEIETFSVHKKLSGVADSQKLTVLAGKTTYIYEQSLGQHIKNNLACLLSSPLVYLKVLLLAFSDILHCLKSPKLAAGVGYRFFMGASLACSLKQKCIQHLHIHFADVPTDIGMYGSLLAGIPYSVTAHANDIFDRAWLLKQKVSRSKFFGTISNFNIRWLTAIGADSQKLQVVRCGVDSAHFTPRPLKAKSEPVVFGFLGRLVEKKGAIVLIEACAKLKRSGLQFVVQLVGNGPLQQSLQQRADELNVGDCVKFLGAKPHSEISPWLESLDYFVLPCVKDSRGDMDGIPVALMEAMLKGVPVVSTDISGIPELVVNGETGLTALTGSIDSLAEIMLSALNETEAAVAERNRAAEKLVQVEYDLHVNASKLHRLITAA